MTYDKRIDLYDDKESSKAQKTSKETTSLVVSDVVDQEMMPCERLMSRPSEIDSGKATTSICEDMKMDRARVPSSRTISRLVVEIRWTCGNTTYR